MIELTYRQLVSTPIAPTMHKLTQMSVFDGKTAYRIHKIYQKIQEFYMKSMAEFETLGLQLGKKDEEGRPLKNEKGQHIPEDDKKDAYEVELENFLETKFQIAQLKLNIHALTARFSPMEIASLEPLVDGLEDAPENVA
jgi:hypothetical protein